MKKLILVLALALLAGCGKKTESVKEITGGFGWAFGQQIPSGSNVRMLNGKKFYLFTPADTNGLPFQQYTATAGDDGKVFSISGYGLMVDEYTFFQSRNEISQQLTKHYGPPKKYFDLTQGEVQEFGHGERRATFACVTNLYEMTLTYTDSHGRPNYFGDAPTNAVSGL